MVIVLDGSSTDRRWRTDGCQVTITQISFGLTVTVSGHHSTIWQAGCPEIKHPPHPGSTSAKVIEQVTVLATRLVLGAAMLLLTGAASAIATDARETDLFAALDRFEAGDRRGGLKALDRIIESYPRFLAAYLVKAALLRAGDLDTALRELAPHAAESSALKGPRSEAYARLSYWFDRPPPDHLPDILIEAAPDRKMVVGADAARARLYLFEWSGEHWTQRGDWYASIGWRGPGKRREGDGKTPLGVYFVTMHVESRGLPEFYGAGSLGLNYPNGWDRLRRRTGYGIWIHGEPRGLTNRAPRWSQGCLVISNPALETLKRMIGEESVPVIIAERIRWMTPVDHARHRSEWRARVESLGGSGAANRGRGIYGYPVDTGKETAMVFVEFRTKRTDGGRWWQYWRENGNGVWRIAHEAPASFLDIHRKGLPRKMPASALHRYSP